MRWQFFAAAAMVAAVATPASAQLGPDRRFTRQEWDVNRSDRIIYVPIGWSFRGAAPGRQPYDVAVASWFRQPVGSQGARPDQVRDDGQYVLERFETVRGEGQRSGAMRVVVTQRPAPPTGTDMPMLSVTDPNTLITTRVQGNAERMSDGMRYTFDVERPPMGYATAGDPLGRRGTAEYEIRLLPARDVRLPRHITRAPTFGGEEPEIRRNMPPPQLPVAERVAGRRIEYRTGRVVDDNERVAGKRQEFRNRR